MPRHYHEAEQIALIHKGRARVTTGGQKVHTLGPGGIWVVPSKVVHSVEYVGDTEAIEVVSPPGVDTLVGYWVPHTFLVKESNLETKTKKKRSNRK